MKKNWLAFLFAVALLPAFTACVSTVNDGKKGGIPFTRDTIESRYPRSVDQLAVATREVLGRNGTITSDDAVKSSIVAQVNEATVYVKLEELEPEVTRVLVQVRSGASGDIGLAAEIDKQIALQLK